MRERHFPRICRSCEAPMARQEDSCWDCGAPWSDGPAQNALRVHPGGAAGRRSGGERPMIPAAATSGTRVAQVR
jgi:hypothetical protein